MRKLISVGMLILGLCLAAAAADEMPKVEVYGGVSFLHIDDNGLHAPKRNFAGWDSEFQFNINKFLGITADIGGNYGRVQSDVCEVQILDLRIWADVQLSPGACHHFRAHSVRAEQHQQERDLGFCDPGPTDSAFAMAWGGGIDVTINKTFAIRLGQLDWLYTRHDLTSVGGKGFQNNIRYTGGMTLSFGGR